MAIETSPADSFVVLYSVPWETYEQIAGALAETKARHTYDHGALELRAHLSNLSWGAYKRFLEALGDYSLRHTYREGTLEMMSPRKDHDWVKNIIGRMIESLTQELGLPVQSVGSMTLTGEKAEVGLQPDESYYIANEPRVRGKDSFDPSVDPPPDLVVEVDVTSSSLKRLPVFAALGIPEIWRHDGKQLIFYHLASNGEYVDAPTSLSFPSLAPKDVYYFLDQRKSLGENMLLLAFLQWVRNQPWGKH